MPKIRVLTMQRMYGIIQLKEYWLIIIIKSFPAEEVGKKEKKWIYLTCWR